MPTCGQPVVGVVGGIGSGKSQVAAELARRGNGVLISGDQFGHEALRDLGVKEKVVARFGRDVLDEDGEVVRRRLAAKVFAESRELRALEAISFPFIEARIVQEIAAARKRSDVKLIVLDAAILFEAGWGHVCDETVFVDTPRDIRLERLKKNRAWTEEELTSRENMQMDLAKKKRLCRHVIDNSGTLEELADTVAALVRTLGI